MGGMSGGISSNNDTSELIRFVVLPLKSPKQYNGRSPRESSMAKTSTKHF